MRAIKIFLYLLLLTTIPLHIAYEVNSRHIFGHVIRPFGLSEAFDIVFYILYAFIILLLFCNKKIANAEIFNMQIIMTKVTSFIPKFGLKVSLCTLCIALFFNVMYEKETLYSAKPFFENIKRSEYKEMLTAYNSNPDMKGEMLRRLSIERPFGLSGRFEYVFYAIYLIIAILLMFFYDKRKQA